MANIKHIRIDGYLSVDAPLLAENSKAVRLVGFLSHPDCELTLTWGVKHTVSQPDGMRFLKTPYSIEGRYPIWDDHLQHWLYILNTVGKTGLVLVNSHEFTPPPMQMCEQCNERPVNPELHAAWFDEVCDVCDAKRMFEFAQHMEQKQTR